MLCAHAKPFPLKGTDESIPVEINRVLAAYSCLKTVLVLLQKAVVNTPLNTIFEKSRISII